MDVKDERLIFLGQKLRDVRTERHLTQQELADLSGRGHRTIQRIELAEENASYIVLYELVHHLGISADTLFYPDMASDEQEVRNLLAKLSGCTEWQRQFILGSLNYMTTQFLEKQEAQEPKELAGAGV